MNHLRRIFRTLLWERELAQNSIVEIKKLKHQRNIFGKYDGIIPQYAKLVLQRLG